jgi:hypothetical protein
MSRQIELSPKNGHLCMDGGVLVRVAVGASEYMVPLLLVIAVFIVVDDTYVAAKFAEGAIDAAFVAAHTKQLLWLHHMLALHMQYVRAAHLNTRFRIALPPCAVLLSDVAAGAEFVAHAVLPHIFSLADKASVHIHMTRKLYYVAGGSRRSDNIDSMAHHEVLFPGQIFLVMLCARLNAFLIAISCVLSQIVTSSNTDVCAI